MTELQAEANRARDAAIAHVIVFGTHNRTREGRRLIARALKLIHQINPRRRWDRDHFYYICGRMPAKGGQC